VFILLTFAALLDGPISKFDRKSIDAEMVSARALGDIERCLVDMDGHPAPNVYRQPDRPGSVTLLWVVDNTAKSRIDLETVAGGTRVRSWLSSKQVTGCTQP
jgi:hypothetical protein